MKDYKRSVFQEENMELIVYLMSDHILRNSMALRKFSEKCIEKVNKQ